ncbi:MAG: RHS repeat-associated core domain-containing protein, partial [Bacilli bacterium]|nr:RHS repeat-associated core domain-containing protein [Bacilli bacterium]
MECTFLSKKNALGIIYGIVDQNRNKVVEYSYDAWGKLLSTTSSNSTISNINPFIYKSYYYDKETGLYWLSSRYYNPDWGRFISPDDVEYLDTSSINGLNLYAYCGNDPVNMWDPSGHFFFSALLIGALVGGAIGAGVSAISQLATGDHVINPWHVLLDGTIGAASGLFSATGICTIGAALISGGLGFAGSVGSDLISSNGDW